MLLLVFYTDSFHLRTGVFCHVYLKERLDLLWISSLQCLRRKDNWLTLNYFPLSSDPNFNTQAVMHISPLHTLITSLVSTVWRSWHHPTGERGHVFVTYSCGYVVVLTAKCFGSAFLQCRGASSWEMPPSLLCCVRVRAKQSFRPLLVINIQRLSNNSWVIVTLS